MKAPSEDMYGKSTKRWVSTCQWVSTLSLTIRVYLLSF